MQDGPEECPPGTGCSQINSQNVCICSLCGGSDADEPELQDWEVKSDILGTAEARGAERTSGARGTGGCKGSVVLGKGFFLGTTRDMPLGIHCLSGQRLGENVHK